MPSGGSQNDGRPRFLACSAENSAPLLAVPDGPFAVSGKHRPPSHAFRSIPVWRLGVLLRGKNPANRLVPISVRRLRRKGGEGPQRDERERAVGPSLEGRVVAVLGVLAARQEQRAVPAGGARRAPCPSRAELRGIAPGEEGRRRQEPDLPLGRVPILRGRRGRDSRGP